MNNKQKCVICNSIYSMHCIQPHYVVEHGFHKIPSYHEVLHMINRMDIYNKIIPYNKVCCRMINMAIYNNKMNVVIQINNKDYHYIDLVKMTVESDNVTLCGCFPKNIIGIICY